MYVSSIDFVHIKRQKTHFWLSALLAAKPHGVVLAIVTMTVHNFWAYKPKNLLILGVSLQIFGLKRLQIRQIFLGKFGFFQHIGTVF